MVKQYKLVIFDLDGTLLDTLTDLANAANQTLAQWHFPEHPINDYKYFIGDGVYKLIERALPEDQRSPAMINHVVDRFKINYFNKQTDQTKPYDGVMEILKFLSQRSIKMAVASNKYHQASLDVVKHYFGNDFFDIVLGQRQGVEPKPNPRIVEDILDFTGCCPSQTLFIGDSGVDIRTAIHSNCTAVGAAWGNRPKEELQNNGAQFILEHPIEIKQFFN
jgi:phosphoglycolate phosphatase